MARRLALGHDARIGGVDAVDVGVDVAQVGLDGDRDRDRAGVGAAAAERGDAVALGLDALEAGDDGHLALLEALANLIARNAGDARDAVGVTGLDGDLPALPGARLDAHRLQHDGQQPGRHLLAAGHHRVVLARIVQRGGLAHPGDQLVGGAGHGRDDDRHAVAGIDLALDVARDDADALHIGNRRAAELHYNERHDNPPCVRALVPRLECGRVTRGIEVATRDPGVLLATRPRLRNTRGAGLDRNSAGPANAA